MVIAVKNLFELLWEKIFGKLEYKRTLLTTATSTQLYNYIMDAQTSFLNHRKNLKISYFKIKSQFLCNNYFALRILRLLNKFFL